MIYEPYQSAFKSKYLNAIVKHNTDNLDLPTPEYPCITSTYIDQLHYIGTMTICKTIRNHHLLGTKEGILYIRFNKIEKQVQLQSPKGKRSIFNPFKSKLNLVKRTNYLNDLVNISYGETKVDTNMAVVSVDLSFDDKFLAVGTQNGEVHIFHYGNLQLMEVIELPTCQKYLIFYSNLNANFIHLLEAQLHQFYELLTCDEFGNMHKFYFDIYKLLDNRSLSFKHYQLLDLGHLQYAPNWWEQQAMQFGVQNLKSIVSDIKYLPDLNQNDYFNFILLMKDRIVSFRVLGGKKDIPQITLIQTLIKLDIEIFQDQLARVGSPFVEQTYSNISIGSGTIQEMNQGKLRSVSKQLLLVSFSGLIYIMTLDLQPIKVSILSIDRQLAYIGFTDHGLILLYFNSKEYNIIQIDHLIEYDFARQFLQQQTKVRHAKLSDLITFTLTIQCIPIDDVKIMQDSVYVDERLRIYQYSMMTWRQFLSQISDPYLGLIQVYKLLNKSNPLFQRVNKSDVIDIITDLAIKAAKQQPTYVMSFLLRFQLEDILFDKVRDSMLNFSDLLQQNNIEYIPGQALLELASNMDIKQLTSLLLQLNVERCDKFILLHLCQSKQLYDIMIYISNQSQDWISPVSRLFDSDLLLPYLLMIIDGQSITGDNLFKVDHWRALKQLMGYVSVPSHLEQIITKDPELLIGKHLFDFEVLTVIRQLHLTIELDDQQQLYALSISEPQQDIVFKLFVIIGSAYKKIHPHNKIQICEFTSKAILSKNIIVHRNFHFQLIQWYLKSDIEREDAFYEAHLNMYFQIKEIAQIQQFLSILSQRQRLKTTIEVTLLHLMGRYLDAFKGYIQLKHIKVFKFLNSIFILKLEYPLQNKLILDGVKGLIGIDATQTALFVNKHLSSVQQFIVENLDYDTPGFLPYLQFIFKQNYRISDPTKLRYFEHLCNTNPKEAKRAIRNYAFPLKECLPLAAKLLTIQAIIYSKLGDSKNLISVLSQKLVLKVKLCTKFILKFKTLDQAHKEAVKKILEKIKNICNDEKYEYDHQLWLIALEKFFHENPLRNFTLPSLPQQVKENLIWVCIYLLTNMLLQMNFYDFVQLIVIKYKDLQALIISKIILEIKQIYYDQQQLIYQGQKVFENTSQRLLIEIRNISHRGYAHSRILCCTQNFNQVVLFRCGHNYHVRCIQKCEECMANTEHRTCNLQVHCPLCFDQLSAYVCHLETEIESNIIQSIEEI